MTIQVHRAERRKAKLRLAITGTSGSGKTYSALLIGRGIAGDEGRILLADTENGSGELYANLTEYDVAPIQPPYTTEKYIEVIDYAEKNGYAVVILDSISHAWAGEGGLLEQKDIAAARQKGNTFSAWADISPKHQRFIDAMLTAKLHLIATMRSKTDYVLVTDTNGKSRPEKKGLAPVQRDGMDYEFTTVIDIDSHHYAEASKDRSGLFDGQIFRPTIETGQLLAEWLEDGTATPAPKPAPEPTPAPKQTPTPTAPKTPAKPRPEKTYGKLEVDQIKARYSENGWRMDIFTEAEYEAGVVWDKTLIDADFKKRMDALRANTPKQTPTPAPAQTPVSSPATVCPKCGKPSMTPDDVKQMQAIAEGEKFEHTLCKDCAREWWKEVKLGMEVEPAKPEPEKTEDLQRPFCNGCGERRVTKEEETLSRNFAGKPLCGACLKKHLDSLKPKEEVKEPAPTPEPKYKCSRCGVEMTADKWGQQLMFAESEDKVICSKCMDAQEEGA